MVSHAARPAALLGAIATSTMLAQQTASQPANLRRRSGHGVAPAYERFDIVTPAAFTAARPQQR